MITFDEARAVVAAAPSVRQQWGDGFTVAEYGWENADAYQVVANTADDEPEPFDAPALIVDKRTGVLSEAYGLVGHPPLPDLVPVGHPPE